LGADERDLLVRLSCSAQITRSVRQPRVSSLKPPCIVPPCLASVPSQKTHTDKHIIKKPQKHAYLGLVEVAAAH
jgi:hypothetical protein